MMLKLEQFKKLFPNAKKQEEVYKGLTAAMFLYDIIGKERESYFLAQLAHESCGFLYHYELGNKSYFKRYDGRKDLGNTVVGDGYRYRGRGFIQLTGRANYREFGKKLGLDLENNPDIAADPQVAAKVAAQYWKDRKCNELADKQDFRGVTKKINGGYNGYADRVSWLNKIQKYA
jgi:putative chitinase